MGSDDIDQIETPTGSRISSSRNGHELRELDASPDLSELPKPRSKLRLCAVMIGLNVSS